MSKREVDLQRQLDETNARLRALDLGPDERIAAARRAAEAGINDIQNSRKPSLARRQFEAAVKLLEPVKD